MQMMYITDCSFLFILRMSSFLSSTSGQQHERMLNSLLVNGELMGRWRECRFIDFDTFFDTNGSITVNVTNEETTTMNETNEMK